MFIGLCDEAGNAGLLWLSCSKVTERLWDSKTDDLVFFYKTNTNTAGQDLRPVAGKTKGRQKDASWQIFLKEK